MPLGATCLIERQNGSQVEEIESEVVGFNGQKLFLMPLEEVEGITPAHAFMPASAVTAAVRENNYH